MVVFPVGLLCSAWGAFVWNTAAMGAVPAPENEVGTVTVGVVAAVSAESTVGVKAGAGAEAKASASTPADTSTSTRTNAGAEARAERERWEETLKARDKEQMLQIWRAIRDFRKARGRLPDFLSDLVPDFLPDKAMLLSPVENAYFRGAPDPKCQTSYSYEFSGEAYGPDGAPFRAVKEAQMKEFGPVVPILRCFAHGEVVMNVSFAGDYYESTLFWEDSAGAQELMRKKGAGGGFEEGDFTDLQVVDGRTGAVLAGAEVQLTQRYYRDLALPDRTLKTDAQGHVRVPLGPPPARRLTVRVVKPGYTAEPETWEEKALPVEKTWSLMPAE